MKTNEIKDTVDAIKAIETSLKSWMPTKWRKEQLADLKALKNELETLRSN